jgi:hypothetical protein
VNLASNDSRSIVASSTSAGLPEPPLDNEYLVSFAGVDKGPSPPPPPFSESTNSLSRQDTQPSIVLSTFGPSQRQSTQEAGNRGDLIFNPGTPWSTLCNPPPQFDNVRRDTLPSIISPRQNSDEDPERGGEVSAEFRAAFIARIPSSGSPQELSRRATGDSAATRFQQLGFWEKRLFILSIVVFLIIVTATLAVICGYGNGQKRMVRSLFLGAILVLALIVGIGMIMWQRNFGEVMFAVMLVIVVGIFVGGGGYLDVIGYGMDPSLTSK